MARPTIKEYKGGNERLDRLISEHFPKTKLYMVNGVYGRKPVEAADRDAAREVYESTYKDRVRA